jgi:hypothetical protein
MFLDWSTELLLTLPDSFCLIRIVVLRSILYLYSTLRGYLRFYQYIFIPLHNAGRRESN